MKGRGRFISTLPNRKGLVWICSQVVKSNEHAQFSPKKTKIQRLKVQQIFKSNKLTQRKEFSTRLTNMKISDQAKLYSLLCSHTRSAIMQDIMTLPRKGSEAQKSQPETKNQSPNPLAFFAENPLSTVRSSEQTTQLLEFFKSVEKSIKMSSKHRMPLVLPVPHP